jgi:hypothetical protein
MFSVWEWVEEGGPNPQSKFNVRRTTRLLFVVIGVPVVTGLPWVAIDRWVEYSSREKERARQLKENEAAAEQLIQSMAKSIEDGTANDATRVLFGLRPISEIETADNLDQSKDADGKTERVSNQKSP